ncbi:MAG: hypothetical protein ACE37K_23940 [Planctomycetota bacterium]
MLEDFVHYLEVRDRHEDAQLLRGAGDSMSSIVEDAHGLRDHADEHANLGYFIYKSIAAANPEELGREALAGSVAFLTAILNRVRSRAQGGWSDEDRARLVEFRSLLAERLQAA